jgi:hypothetical protein
MRGWVSSVVRTLRKLVSDRRRGTDFFRRSHFESLELRQLLTGSTDAFGASYVVDISAQLELTAEECFQPQLNSSPYTRGSLSTDMDESAYLIAATTCSGSVSTEGSGSASGSGSGSGSTEGSGSASGSGSGSGSTEGSGSASSSGSGSGSTEGSGSASGSGSGSGSASSTSSGQPPSINGFGWTRDGSWLRVTGSVSDDEDPTGLTINFGGLLQGGGTAVLDGDYFIFEIQIGNTVEGSVTAQVTDRSGLTSALVSSFI